MRKLQRLHLTLDQLVCLTDQVSNILQVISSRKRSRKSSLTSNNRGTSARCGGNQPLRVGSSWWHAKLLRKFSDLLSVGTKSHSKRANVEDTRTSWPLFRLCSSVLLPLSGSISGVCCWLVRRTPASKLNSKTSSPVLTCTRSCLA